MPYFGPLLNQRLTELDATQKEYKYLAGADPWCPWWEAAEEREEAIQAKLAEQAIGSLSDPPFYYWGSLTPWQLGFGIPDAERVYLTRAERARLTYPSYRGCVHLPPGEGPCYVCADLSGSEYLRRHPEMVEFLQEPVLGNPAWSDCGDDRRGATCLNPDCLLDGEHPGRCVELFQDPRGCL